MLIEFFKANTTFVIGEERSATSLVNNCSCEGRLAIFVNDSLSIIFPSKITTIKGLIKQKQKNIHFFALSFIPDISVKQSRIQRFLNYGTVFISGGERDTVSIRDVDQPRKVMMLVEDLINKKRNERDAAEGKHTS